MDREAIQSKWHERHELDIIKTVISLSLDGYGVTLISFSRLVNQSTDNHIRPSFSITE